MSLQVHGPRVIVVLSLFISCMHVRPLSPPISAIHDHHPLELVAFSSIRSEVALPLPGAFARQSPLGTPVFVRYWPMWDRQQCASSSDRCFAHRPRGPAVPAMRQAATVASASRPGWHTEEPRVVLVRASWKITRSWACGRLLRARVRKGPQRPDRNRAPL